MVKLFILSLLISCTATSSKYPITDHYDGVLFSNYDDNSTKSLWDVFKWRWSSQRAKWPAKIDNISYELPLINPRQRAVVTFINHATFLVQTNGVNFITDPIFSERASPVSFAGPKRVRDPGQELKKLPKIHAVIISHNHYDHMDLKTLKQLEQKDSPVFIVPLGNKNLLESVGIKNVIELDWWQEHKVGSASVIFSPCQHWSARTPFDKKETLWGSYMVKNGDFQFYFAGDTGYGKHFSETSSRLGRPDIALLPIGAYLPREFMKQAHTNPEEAIKAHLDLKSKLSIGMHFGTFQLSDEAIEAPIKELEEFKKKYRVDNFKILDHGESISLPLQ